MPISETAAVLLFITPIMWIVAHINFTKSDASDAMFNTVYEMAVALLAAYSLLRMTQKTTSLISQPDFWFLTAIFSYCFCTFFEMAFLHSSQMHKIWFFHNLFDMIAYLVYTIGFFKIETEKSPA